MKKSTAIVSAAVMAAVFTCSAVPTANAELLSYSAPTAQVLTGVKDNEGYYNYKAFTLDEVIGQISGESIALFSTNRDYPCMYENEIITLDTNNKYHTICLWSKETVVTVKEGTELPISEIEAEIGVPVTYEKNGSQYIIKIQKWGNYYVQNFISSLKKRDNVLCIDNHYKVHEDTANSCSIYGLGFKGDISPEEILNKYPDIGFIVKEKQDELPYDFCLTFDYNDDWSSMDIFRDYDFMKEIFSGDYSVFAGGVKTELAMIMTDDDYYYCSEHIIVDGMEGDANIDGRMNMADVVMIMQSSVNPDKYGLRSAEGITAQGSINGDIADKGSGITNLDALAIQKRLLGLE